MNDQPLPTWLSPPERDNRDNERPMSLTPLEPSKALVSLPEFPRTKEERLLIEQTYEKIFFLSLNAVRGGSSLRFLAKHDHRRINVGRFMQWVKSDPQRKQMLEDAQAVAAELLMAETIDIADGTLDAMSSDDPNAALPSDITRDKLRIDARTKLAGFYDPKKFGDVKRVEMTTNDITTDNVASMSTAELRQFLMRGKSLNPTNVVDGELVT
jgi:hypothetical protein